MPALPASPVHLPMQATVIRPVLQLLLAGLLTVMLHGCGHSNAASAPTAGEAPALPSDSTSPTSGTAAAETATISTTLRIHGLVRQPQMLDVEALRQFEPVTIARIPITSASGSPRGELTNLVGVPLRSLLDKADIRLDDRHDSKKIAIIASGTDDYRVIFSWSELYNTAIGTGVVVLYQQDGQPLPDRSGRIALISRDDLRTGPRHVKWLHDIEVRKIVD